MQQQTLPNRGCACGHRQVHTIQKVEKTVEITEAQYFDKIVDVPGVCQRQEPTIIMTAQKTVEVLQSQSDDQCRSITSCSAGNGPTQRCVHVIRAMP